jgi:mRNA-degrading endonuclease YafQ of YafQ-DinJ toxin-antitoxin module
MFKLDSTENFLRKAAKLIKDERQKKAFNKALNLLSINPFYPSLRTHKVIIKYQNP